MICSLCRVSVPRASVVNASCTNSPPLDLAIVVVYIARHDPPGRLVHPPAEGPPHLLRRRPQRRLVHGAHLDRRDRDERRHVPQRPRPRRSTRTAATSPSCNSRSATSSAAASSRGSCCRSTCAATCSAPTRCCSSGSTRRCSGSPSGCSSITRTIADGLRLFLTALLLQYVGWGVGPAIVVVGVVTIVYTYLGGMKAVIWTDLIQFVIKIAGAVLAGVFVLQLLPGGWDAVRRGRRRRPASSS